jgi:hypothetical protein
MASRMKRCLFMGNEKPWWHEGLEILGLTFGISFGLMGGLLGALGFAMILFAIADRIFKGTLL